eukprot:gene70-10_t
MFVFGTIPLPILCLSLWYFSGQAAELQNQLGGSELNTGSLAELLRKFQQIAVTSRQRSDQWYSSEAGRLSGAVDKVADDNIKAALRQSVAANEVSRIEVGNAYADILNFIDKVGSVIGFNDSSGSIPKSCADVVCGQNTLCTQYQSGAICVCRDGFQGQPNSPEGCRAPRSFIARQLLVDMEKDVPQKFSDPHVTINGDRIGLVWTDNTNPKQVNKGMMMLGQSKAHEVTWMPPEPFFAHGAGEGEYRIGIQPRAAFAIDKSDLYMGIVSREAVADGVGYFLLARVGMAGIKGAAFAVTWMADAYRFSGKVSHQMDVVGLRGGRFVVFYTGDPPGQKVAVSSNQVGLASVFNAGAALVGGNLTVASTQRFYDAPVCRIRATRLAVRSTNAPLESDSYDDFVVAFRANKQGFQAGFTHGFFRKGLMFLDPADGLNTGTAGIWERDVSPVAPNVFLYSYVDSEKNSVSAVTVRVKKNASDEEEHFIKSAPTDLGPASSTPYLVNIPYPYLEKDLHIAVGYAPNAANDTVSAANALALCRMNSDVTIAGCQKLQWSPHRFAQMSALSLGSGVILSVFPDSKDVPYYQLFGLARAAPKDLSLSG